MASSRVSNMEIWDRVTEVTTAINISGTKFCLHMRWKKKYSPQPLRVLMKYYMASNQGCICQISLLTLELMFRHMILEFVSEMLTLSLSGYCKSVILFNL